MKQKLFGYLAAGLIASLIIMLTTGATWGFVLVTVTLLISIINTQSNILGTVTVRTFFALLVTLGAYQLESIAFAIARLDVNVSWYVFTTLAIVIVLWGYLNARRPTSLGLPRFSRLDIVLLLPAVLICGAYTARILLPSEENDKSIVRSITIASDDTAHLSMFDGLLRSHGNLLIHTSSSDKSVAYRYQSYPMGWHLSASVVVSSINSQADKLTMLQTAIAYFATKMLSFFLVTLSLTILVWQIASRLLRSVDDMFTILSLYTLVAFTTFFVSLPQTFEGFFSFFPVLMYISLFASICIELLYSRFTNTKTLDILLLAYIIGSAVSWILTAPILVAAFVVIKLKQYPRLRDIPRWSYIGLGIAVLVLLFQLWVRLSSPTNSISEISAEGGITAPEMSLFLITNIVLLFYFAQRKVNNIPHALLALLVPLYTMMGLILVYVSLKSQTLTYYFVKLEIVAFMLLIPIAGIILCQALTTPKLLPQKRLNSFYQFVLFSTVLLMAIPSVVGYAYYANTVSRVKRPHTLETQDAQVLTQEVLNKQYGQATTRAYFFYPDSRPRSIVGSNIARIGFYNSPCDTTLTSDAYEGIEKFTRDIQRCASELPTIVVYTDTLGSQQLKDIIPQSYFDKKEVTIKLTSN